jgi:signal transduction histidine kinase
MVAAPDQSGEESGNGCRRWRFTVHDNGIGFDEKYRERIFEVFQRLHGRGEYEGSGIGLSLCRKIVSRHGGSIGAESQLGVGSKFFIILPEKQAGANGKAIPAPALAKPTSSSEPAMATAA